MMEETPATRGHQGSPSRRVVRLMIAANVTSAASSGGATRAHMPDAGGLNTRGRMAELDYLFSETDLDIIGAQESTQPQTQIPQTTDYTVFNSGASPGEHHYGVQLWIKKRHAKNREEYRSCQSETACCKNRHASHMTKSLECYMSLSFTHRAKWPHHTTLMTLSICKCTSA